MDDLVDEFWDEIIWLIVIRDITTGDWASTLFLYDFYNRCVPTKKEIDQSINALLQRGLVKQSGGHVALSDRGSALLEECSEDGKTLSDLMDALALRLKDLAMSSTEDVFEIEEQTLNKAIAEYQRRFEEVDQRRE